MKKRLTIGVSVFVIAGLVVWGLSKTLSINSESDAQKNAPPSASSSNNRKPLNVNAVVIVQQTLNNDIELIGRLMADEEVDLSFQTSGLITDIYFSEGTFVTKGELLAKVNDKTLQAELKKYEAQVELAEDRVRRQQVLLQKDAVSKEAYEQVRTDLEVLNANIQSIKASIDLTELRAPFDGLIGLRQVSEGAYASPSTVLAKLTKISPIKVEFSIPGFYSSQIVNGTKVSFTPDGSLESYWATVYATESTVAANTNTLTARALYPNTNGKLLPGKPVKIKVRMEEIRDAIAIPSQAIVPEMGKDKVFLYKNGKAEPVEISKGLRTASEVQVIQGLNVGDTLITSGTLQLRTGLSVILDEIN